MPETLNIEGAIGYKFKNAGLLTLAMTATSYGARNNDRLECLGDCILGFIVTERLFLDPEKLSPGEITLRKQALVSDEALMLVALKLGLDKAILYAKGDDSCKNIKSVPSAYEALVAAVYLDGGMDAAREVVHNTIDFGIWENYANYVGALQEWYQNKYKKTPDKLYSEIACGSKQKPRWKVVVKIDGKNFSSGEHDSIKMAKREAARLAYEFFKDNI